MADSDNVTRLEYETVDSDGKPVTKVIHLIGTAHISRKSVEEVERVIEEIRPDTVCVELDPTRYESLTDATRWQELDIFQVIKEKKVLFLLTSLVLSAYQRKMGEALGVKPGAEMLAAIEKAREIDAELVLADRDIQATLKRTWRRLGFFNKSKVAASLVLSFFAVSKISEEQIEELKDRDNISDMMKEFAKAFPQVKKPLIDERDLYLISKIQEAPGRTIVAVVGAGHVEGMVASLGAKVDRKALEEIPPPSTTSKILKWVIPALVLAVFLKGYFDHEGDDFQEMLTAWVLPNALFAGIGALLSGARPLTTLVAIVGSPITSLNPALPLGVVTGTVEAWLRKPTVADCERILEDSKTLRGVYSNRFTRVLLVSVLTLIGSAIGGWLGAGWLVSFLDTNTLVWVVGILVVLVLGSWAAPKLGRLFK